MSHTLQVFILLALVLYFIILVYLIRRKQLTLKYTLLWIFFGAFMLVFTLFPGLLDRVSSLLGIAAPVNALFAIALFCILIILVSLTAILSHHNACIVKLVQENAMLEERIRELEGGSDTAAADEGRTDER